MRNFQVWSSLRSFTPAYLVLLTLSLALSSAKPLYAQANAGITGTVTDSSGAIVSGATVTITNQATGQAESRDHQQRRHVCRHRPYARRVFDHRGSYRLQKGGPEFGKR